MLARLQKLTTLTIVMAVLAWAYLALRAGRPWFALAGAALIAGSYALVLGIEFVLLSRANLADPAPPAGRRALIQAWWGEVCSAPIVFCWRQPFRSRRWPDQMGAADGTRRGVVLVHRVVCNRGLWNPWLARLTAEGVPFVAVNLEPVFGSIDRYVATIEQAVSRLEKATGLAPLVVAHSMGGLALRRWWVEAGNDERVHHAITIGSPHHGTWLARLALSANGREMQCNSAWLRSLVDREPAERAVRLTCFYSHCDNIVFPASTATLDGARNIHLPAVAHVMMANDRRAMAAMWQLLAD